MYLRVAPMILCFIVVFAVSSADADIYKYVDADGVIHFTDCPTTNRFRMYRPDAVDSLQSVSRWVRHYASIYRLEAALVHAVIKAESNYDPQAVSSKGACGIMQIEPKTARHLGVTDPFNPREAIRGGSSYLRQLLDRFQGNLDLALAAYNAGPTAVTHYGGVPPYPETRNYIKKVKRFMRDFKSGKDVIL